ncbi:IS110 family transposase [Mesorhizobium sp. M0115]|uniref:IS110 family transposase n=1 Tax=Mesorhizobium sp. M0115 TaxID=2956883 RepID=UPI003337E1D1
MTIFVGLDWGGSSHAVCIVDAAGKILDRFAVAHDRDGLADLVARLRRYAASCSTCCQRVSTASGTTACLPALLARPASRLLVNS